VVQEGDMPDDNNADNGGQNEQGKADGGQDFKAITSQADLDKVLGERLARERAKYADYEDLKAKAAKVDEATEASKTEAQKLADRIKAAEDRATAAESTALRFRIANEYKLSQEDAMALEHVASEEGMKSIAERLRAAADSGRRTPPKPQSLASGSSGEPKTGEKGRAAAALRSLRQG
jgi:hypothetical protein